MTIHPAIIKYIYQPSGIVLLSCFCCLVSFAQPVYADRTLSVAIQGMVVDSASQAKLAHVTVEVQEVKNGSSLKTLLTDENGSFAFTGLPVHTRYSLTFSYTGYKAATLHVPYFTDSAIHLGQVALVSQVKQLKEVQVTSQKPLLEQSLDKLTYHVDADPESLTASAFDILRKIPLLSIDGDDHLQLNGNSNYRVLINGKSSSLFMSNQTGMFKNLSASAIKTIEVITVPSSKYEAAGIGGIINITTYRKNIGGYNGGVNVRASDPKGLSTNGNLSVKAGKFSFSGNFGLTNSTSPSSSNTMIRQDKIRKSRLEQSGRNHSQNWSQNGGGEMSFEINERNILTAGYSANKGGGTNHYTQHVILYNDFNEPAVTYRRGNDGRTRSNGNDFSVDYQRNFKNNEARQLTLAFKQSNNHSGSGSQFTLQPSMDPKAATSITDNKDVSREHVLQADYIQPIKKHTLEMGGSAIRRQNTSDYFYKVRDTASGVFVLDNEQSNNFRHREDIFSGYTSLNLRMGKWRLRMGARLELVQIDAHFRSSGTTASQGYENMVPNLTLSRQLKGVSTLRLSYTQRIQRPSLFYLDPYVDKTDPWNISFGNPHLQPAQAHVFNTTYNTFFKKTAITISTFHQFTNNAIQQFTWLDADTIARTTYGNIGRNRNTSLSVSLNSTFFKFLAVNLNGNANYIEHSSMINGKTGTNSGLTYSVTGGAHLRLKTWRLAGNISHNAPNVLAQGRTAAYTTNSATVNKYFLKNNKASIGLSVSSLFREHRRSFTEIDDPAFYLWRESLSVIRHYTISFHYLFVKVQGSENGKREK